jgi:hypothetical protein
MINWRTYGRHLQVFDNHAISHEFMGAFMPNRGRAFTLDALRLTQKFI